MSNKSQSGIKFSGRYVQQSPYTRDGVVDLGSECHVIVKGFVPVDLTDMKAFGEAVKTVSKLNTEDLQRDGFKLVGEFKSTVGNVLLPDPDDAVE